MYVWRLLKRHTRQSIYQEAVYIVQLLGPWCNAVLLFRPLYLVNTYELDMCCSWRVESVGDVRHVHGRICRDVWRELVVFVYVGAAAHGTRQDTPPPLATTTPWRAPTATRTLPTGSSRARRSGRRRCRPRKQRPRRSARGASAPAASTRRTRRR